MERRTILKIGCALFLVGLVCSAGFWYLFVDTPAVAPTELDAKSPYPPDTTADSYALVANASTRSLSNESDWSRWETTVRYDGSTNEKFGRLTSSSPRRNVSIEAYHRYVGNTTEEYARYRSSVRAVFRERISSIRDDLDPRTEALRVDNGTRTYYHYERESGQRDLGMGQIRTGLVVLPPYERAGATTVDGRNVTKYVPVDGWVDMAGSSDVAPEAYVSDTAGAVYVSRATGRIVRANLSFTSKRTEIRIGRWLGTTGTRIHVRLSVTRPVETASVQPGWVTETDNDYSRLLGDRRQRGSRSAVNSERNH
jgi:hypothetical protein